MNQPGFEFITPVERTRYLVVHRGKKVKAWFMCNMFIFDNYHVAEDCKIIEIIGTEEEIWG